LSSRTTSIDKRTADLVKENALRRDVVDLLVEKSLPLDGSIRVLRALQKVPEDLWIERIEVAPASSGRGNRHGLIKVKGKGKEVSGTPLDVVFRGFAAELKQRDDLGAMKTPSTPKDNQLDFDLEFDLLPPAPAPTVSKKEAR
jgi:hypothetical protein